MINNFIIHEKCYSQKRVIGLNACLPAKAGIKRMFFANENHKSVKSVKSDDKKYMLNCRQNNHDK